MKKFKVFIFSLLLITLSCEDEDKNPFPAKELESAAVLRTITILNRQVDINNINGSEISVEVEADDFKDNSLMEDVDVYVQFIDSFFDEDGTLTPSNPNDDDDISRDEVLIETIPIANFTLNSNGKPRRVISVTAQDAIQALELTPDLDKVDGGDIFRVRFALNLKDGRIFSSNNVGNNVTGAFFNSPFRYDGSVICGYSSTFLVGNYQLEWVSGLFPAFGVTATFEDGPVTITASSGTERQVTSANYLVPFNFAGPIDFDLICGKTVVPTQNSGGGVGCGPGSITMRTPDLLNAGAFDINGIDDSVFTLVFDDAVTDGACGVSPYRVVLRFTKL